MNHKDFEKLVGDFRAKYIVHACDYVEHIMRIRDVSLLREIETSACIPEQEGGNFRRDVTFWASGIILTKQNIQTSKHPKLDFACTTHCCNGINWKLLPDWFSTDVVLLCEGYAASEVKDHSLLPIIADAFQDAGCDDEDVLEHLRLSQPHKCFVVDMISLQIPSLGENK